MESNPIIVTCGRGCAPVLAVELQQLGFETMPAGETALLTQGTWPQALRLCLWLRTAHRVLWQVAEFRAHDAEEFYRETLQVPWERWLSSSGYFSVHGFVQHPSITDSRYAVLKCKDAIADRMTRKTGARPDSGGEQTRAVIAFHWMGDKACVYLDLSGEPLSHRGYRRNTWTAPMRESLAASVLLASGWNGETPFINPMCGSGTLAIEAAWLALNRAPGLLRKNFGFMHLAGFDSEQWEQLREEATRQIKPQLPAPIVAGDVAPPAIRASLQNAQAALVDRLVEFQVADFRRMRLPEGPSAYFFNPDYGERGGDQATLELLYPAIGDFLKERAQGCKAWVFTGNLELGRKIGLKPSRRWPFWNGDIECRLLQYEMYAGTRDRRLLNKHAEQP